MKKLNQQQQIISVTSGKGGVGKTTLVSNLALRYSQQGKKVLILDGDLGMANIDIFFGYRADVSIYDVLTGKKKIRDILIEVSKGIFVIPGGSGVISFNHINNFHRRAIVEALSDLPTDFDVILIDTAPGISENVLYLNASADHVSVLINQDPSSFADAYALIKILHLKQRINKFYISCNMVKDEAEGVHLYEKFSEVVGRFLHVGLDYLGSIPMDVVLRRANINQRLILRHDQQSISAQGIIKIADRLSALNSRSINHSTYAFWEQVMGVA